MTARKLAIIASFPLFIAAARFLPLNRLPSTCVFYHVTGYPCFTCGMTRATAALARLDFERAMAYHPLAVAFVGVFALLWGALVYGTLTHRSTALMGWVQRHVLRLVLSAFGLLMVYGVWRIVNQALR
jgi:hypothetical protein